METTESDACARGEEFRIRARAGLAPEVVQRLARLTPARATLSLVETWGTIALLVAVALWFEHPAVTAAAILGIAARQHALAILAHQAAQYRLFRTRWLNDFAGRACGFPLGVSMLTYRLVHRRHHNHLYEPIDPDLALMAGYPRGRLYLLGKLLKDLLGATVLKNYRYFVGRPPGSEAGATPEDDASPALRAAARRDRAWLGAFVVIVAAASIATGAWRPLLVLWLLPLATVLQALLRLRAVCEHGAPLDTKNPLRAARTTLAPAYVRWFLFPHDMHFHIEHHLYPQVPHYRLADCHRELARLGVLDDAEVVTFRETLRRIFAPRLAAV